MSEMEESAKAIQEVAKLGTTSVNATTKIGSFLARVFGMPLENAVGLIGDKIEYTRWERQNRLIDKVVKEQTKRGLTQFRAVPPKFAIPIIFNASIEEDNDLQDIWCNLLINCSDPMFDTEIRYAFIDIIKNITSLDAKILKYVYDTTLEMNEKHGITRFITLRPFAFPVTFTQIKENLLVSTMEIEISMNNLKRVQCVWDNAIPEIRSNIAYLMKIKPGVSKADYSYKITPLGHAFILACMK
jgi:hypothetical protein